jgi:hypothetical protein
MRSWNAEGVDRGGCLLLAFVASFALAGCGAQPKRVSCDGRLEPINAPAQHEQVSEDASAAADLERARDE